jgi:hypothetical protein
MLDVRPHVTADVRRGTRGCAEQEGMRLSGNAPKWECAEVGMRLSGNAPNRALSKPMWDSLSARHCSALSGSALRHCTGAALQRVQVSQLPEQRRHHRAHPTPPHPNTALQRRRTLCRCGASGPQHRNMRRCDVRALWWFQDFSLLDHTGYTALHQVGLPACHSYSTCSAAQARLRSTGPTGQCAAALHSSTALHCTALPWRLPHRRGLVRVSPTAAAQHSTARHGAARRSSLQGGLVGIPLTHRMACPSGGRVA